jgi:hypothetical protein
METTGRGVPDTSHAWGMTISREAMLLLLLATIIPATPAFAEPCSKAAVRSKIAETLRLASEQRPINLTFRTAAEGVKMPERLRSKYPDEMTIMLQYEFSKLDVKDDRFDVMLSLQGNPERLSVPFTAIKAFWDKSELKCSDS